MHTKPEIITALKILFNLSKETEKELGKLSKPALEEIFEKYKANALSQANALSHWQDKAFGNG